MKKLIGFILALALLIPGQISLAKSCCCCKKAEAPKPKCGCAAEANQQVAELESENAALKSKMSAYENDLVQQESIIRQYRTELDAPAAPAAPAPVENTYHRGMW